MLIEQSDVRLRFSVRSTVAGSVVPFDAGSVVPFASSVTEGASRDLK